MKFRTIPILLAFCLAQALFAQSPARINDPSAIVLQPDLGRDPAAQAGMQAAGLSGNLIQDAVKMSDPMLWPPGLRTEESRMANRGAIMNYAASLLCSYSTEEGPLAIIAIPASANRHMPEDLRASSDFFLVMRPAGFTIIDETVAKDPPSKGPSWRNLRRAQILKPDGVYATYDLADVPEAMEALDKQGLSKAEIEAVAFRSHERNWPDGIDSFEKRYPRLKQLKKLKAYRLARWSDKVILVIPADQNKKAPLGLRPYLDIYMVFDATSVKVADKKR